MHSVLLLTLCLGQITPNPWPIADDPPDGDLGVGGAAQLAPTDLVVVGDDEVIEEDSTILELFEALTKVIDDWRNLGWLAGLIAAINFLIALLRFRWINNFFTKWDIKWLKPLLATVLGGAIGGLSVAATGASAINSVLAGCLAGLGSVGFHELISSLRVLLSEKIKRDKAKA